jgi:hypothetical protein
LRALFIISLFRQSHCRDWSKSGLTMKFDDAEQLLKAADADGLRRVLVVTALALELKAVMVHLKLIGSCNRAPPRRDCP